MFRGHGPPRSSLGHSFAVPSVAAVAVAHDVVAEADQLTPQLALVDLTREPLRAEDAARVHRPPLALRAAVMLRSTQWERSRGSRVRLVLCRKLPAMSRPVVSTSRPPWTHARTWRSSSATAFKTALSWASRFRLSPLTSAWRLTLLVRGDGHVPARAPLVLALAVRHQDAPARRVATFQQAREVVRFTGPESPSWEAPRQCQRDATMPPLCRSV